MYNLSISSGVVPVQWKKAIITPVAKVSQAVSASDYRPISVTSILSRKLEHEIVARHIYPAMLEQTNDLEFNDQFAFRPTGSATAALIATIGHVTDLPRSGKTVILISLDFSKAFDKVRHQTLFEKLDKMDIDDRIFNWMVSYFENRTHSTKFLGNVSNEETINASVV